MNNDIMNIESYLEGKQPLLPELTAVPTDEELEAAEKEFDSIAAKATRLRGGQRSEVEGRRSEVEGRGSKVYLRSVAWVGLCLSAAAAVALAFVLWPQGGSESPSVATRSTVVPAIAINTASDVSESVSQAKGDLNDNANDNAVLKQSSSKSRGSATEQRLAVVSEAPASSVKAVGNADQQTLSQMQVAHGASPSAELAAIEAETLAALSAVEAEAMQQAIEAQQKALATCSTPNQPS